MKTYHHLLLPALILAPIQALTASSICVTVVDPIPLPLRGAVVKIVGLLEGDKRFATATDQQGRACTGDLPEGLYSVEVGLEGFLNVRYYPVRVVFPKDQDLQFQLPFAEITEGGTHEESVLSGTLEEDSKPLSGIQMCLFEDARTSASACTTTNDLGQYALAVPPAIYWLELNKLSQNITRVKIDLSNSGYYRNKVSLPSGVGRQSSRSEEHGAQR